jgi:hypothetical protein
VRDVGWAYLDGGLRQQHIGGTQIEGLSGGGSGLGPLVCLDRGLSSKLCQDELAESFTMLRNPVPDKHVMRMAQIDGRMK